ncbi:hypothetical protein [Streptomyces sp. NRRL WC-3742]|uniref:hypothetical protein n=1 Tax=Streptomyces sp. NRRL WC-3742 TaxID=1463934 RepID=UPI00099C4954|nr:hypothetical protein [Streptomyces sp. NRRL WC-3742]
MRGRDGLWFPFADLDSVREHLPHGGVGLVAVRVAGDEVSVLPDLVHVGREVGGVEGDFEVAVVAGAGDGPAAGTHRGPREVDVCPSADPLGTLALGLLVREALPLGRQLGLVPLLGLLAAAQELGPTLGSLAFQLDGALAGSLAAAGGLLAAGQRGQGFGLVAGGPGLGEVGAVVPPDGEHGAAVGGGNDVAVRLFQEEPGGDGQFHHLAAHAAALGPEAGPGGDEAVAGAGAPHHGVGVLAAGRCDEGVEAGGPPGLLAGLGVARGGEEAADLAFVVVGVEAGGVLGVVLVVVAVADLGGVPGVGVAAGEAPDGPPAAPGVGVGADRDGAGVAQPPLQDGPGAGYPQGAVGGGGHWCLSCGWCGSGCSG